MREVSRGATLDRVTDTACGKPHYAAPPNISAANPQPDAPGDCDDDIHDLWLQDARVLELDLDRPELTDVRLVDCDVSGLATTGFVARRVELTGTRLRGVTFANGQYDDGRLEGCITSELSFRFSRLRRVVFTDCDLSGIDFYSASFDHVTIERCDLQRARFDAASVNCLSVTNCNLAGISGASGLRGARLDASDLPSLAVSLAREAGIDIRDS
jgi:uncharacterized protein YjbI with pentapeptide repeats